MIYKTTYQLCTVILFVGMGLMHWKSSNQYHQQQIFQQRWIQSLENQNDMLKRKIEREVNILKYDVRRRSPYKKLVDFAMETDRIVKGFTYTEPVYTRYTILDHKEIWKQYQKIVPQLEHQLQEIGLQRRIGVRQDDIKSLRKQMNFELSQPITHESFTEKDSLALKLQWVEMNNNIQLAGTLIVNYLGSRIGCHSWKSNRTVVLSSPKSKTLKVGEVFETIVFLSERIRYSTKVTKVLINGKEIPFSDEDGFAKYKEVATRKGRIEYLVEMNSICPTTKKEQTNRRKFSYLVI